MLCVCWYLEGLSRCIVLMLCVCWYLEGLSRCIVLMLCVCWYLAGLLLCPHLMWRVAIQTCHLPWLLDSVLRMESRPLAVLTPPPSLLKVWISRIAASCLVAAGVALVFGPLAGLSLQVSNVTLDYRGKNNGGPNLWISKIIPWLLKIRLSLLKKSGGILRGWHVSGWLWLTDPQPPRTIHSVWLTPNDHLFSLTDHRRNTIIAPGWASVNPSQFPHHLPKFGYILLSRRERWIFNNRGMISDLNPLVGNSIFLPWWSELGLAIWSQELATGPYQKNTPPAAGLVPAIYRLQMQALPNWTILASCYAVLTIVTRIIIQVCVAREIIPMHQWEVVWW